MHLLFSNFLSATSVFLEDAELHAYVAILPQIHFDVFEYWNQAIEELW